MSKDKETPRRASGLFTSGGMITELAALIGASCCVLTILLVQAGLSAVLVANLDVFTRSKPHLPALTAVLILAGFVAAFWGGRWPRSLVLVLLIAAALLVVGAYVMPHYERELLDWVGGR